MRSWKWMILLSVLFLTGCSSEEIQQEQETLTVVLWDYDKISYDRELIAAYEEANPQVHVEVISYPDAYYDTKMETLIKGGRQADVFFARTVNSLEKLIKYDAVYPLDDLIKEEGLDLAETPTLEQYRIDGTAYAVPYRNDQYVLFYNCDLFDKAGLDYPSGQVTWEDIYVLARELKGSLSEDQYAMMTLPMDIQWVVSGKQRSEEQEAESLRPVIEWLLKMQEEGLTPSYADCIAGDIQQQCFELGNYAMYVGGSWYVNYLTSDQKKDLVPFSWGITNAPAWEADKEASVQSTRSILTGAGITKQSEKKELAYSFIQFITGREGAGIMAQEQMMPAYLDDEIQQIYENNFVGSVLDASVYENKTEAVYTRSDDRIQQILCEGFRKAETGQSDVEHIIEEMEEKISVQ